mmetsp:Transcript_50240/g.151237  ORF Transcript_50240/g.151237 Transcript_50240/m.151237 type:complete len:125 (-) Transcript_50240:51-425(-)
MSPKTVLSFLFRKLDSNSCASSPNTFRNISYDILFPPVHPQQFKLPYLQSNASLSPLSPLYSRSPLALQRLSAALFPAAPAVAVTPFLVVVVVTSSSSTPSLPSPAAGLPLAPLQWRHGRRRKG